ncbi:hypothetical protein [Scatolibacter rhodanostii]|uniref:hypothetical protein n=1 Tax=Scatolibacter rhodanostii TaxID=2014781 RepID=UPI000C087203|nr:hypothetical protein [Scatolibacter rhodanostii]
MMKNKTKNRPTHFESEVFHRRTKRESDRFAIPLLILCLGLITLMGCSDISEKKSEVESSQVAALETESKLESEKGVYLEKMELPESNGDLSSDMIGVVVYQGAVYLQAEYLTGDNEVKQALIGEYLGETIDSIDEWSKQDKYSQEFASNMAGAVHTVNGYDSSFRICIQSPNTPDNDIWLYENINGITLTTGEDLYGTRLHLKDNYQEVLGQSHDDWDNGRNNYKTIDLSEETIAKFVDILYTSAFEDLSQEPESLYEIHQEQAHLYFKMKDSTSVHLRLFENGYVGYGNSPTGQAFVKISNPMFSEIFQAVMA